MSLTERLERLAKQLDAERWECVDHGRYVYNVEAVETADLLIKAASALRGFALLLDEARHAVVRH